MCSYRYTRQMEKLALLVAFRFLSFSFAVPANEFQRLKAPDEDARLTFLELCAKYNYTCRDYKFQTDDGYILTIHRILQSPKCKITSGKKVAYLQHGLLSSSFDWIIIGPDNGALGYLLADCCYDVWLGNFRGNFYSRNHGWLKPDSEEFWDFSWHEIGQYDLPATIDFILEKTKQDKLIYIGHSQGTTTFYVMCELRPDMCSKIHASFQLAPVAFLGESQSYLLRLLSKSWIIVGWLLDVCGVNEFLPTSSFLRTAGGILCSKESPFSQICANVLFILCGWNSELYNATLLPTVLGHTPAGASTKQVIHYAQCMESKRFQQYDRGIKNLWVYGSFYPPSYKIERTCAPVFMFMGENDNFSSMKDCATLWGSIPKEYQGWQYIVPHKKFNHLDFLFAKNVKALVYEPLCRQMEQFSGLHCDF